MSVIEHTDRIFTLRKRNAQNARAYIAIFSHGGYQPTAPNSNVVGYARPSFEYIWEEDEEEPVKSRPGLGIEFVIFPPTVAVPNLIHLNISDALTALANVSLIGAYVTVSADLSFAYNTVVTQDIPASTPVGQNTVVNMTIQALTIVPNVVGKSKTGAIADLTAAFLTAGFVNQISTAAPGTVLAQSIPQGTPEFANTVVVLTIAIAGDGFRVQAVTAGWYQGAYYNPGEVFDLLQASDFSDSSLNYEGGGGEYAGGWMVQTAPATPVTLDDGQAFFPAVDPNRRFVE